MRQPVKIANAAGFWGDQPGAAARLLRQQPDLDFITLDYLAEVSLSIMAIIRAKDPAAGYAKDFLQVVKSLVPFWEGGGGTRVVTNAGGLDPAACAAACRSILREAGLLRLKIAVVTGDDVLPMVQANPEAFPHLDEGTSLGSAAGRLMTANAYLGAETIAQALRAGADIVITGRGADPSLTVGPCLAHFGWTMTDYDRLAGATVAGHLLECGTQACGGFSTDWLELPGNDEIGFPIAEVAGDGSCIITKPAATGGAVTLETVKEQLLYEIGDPANYLSPDVTVSFLTLKLEAVSDDRVRVAGATGQPPPKKLKVSATYRDGYKAHGLLTVFGHDAVRKARAAGDGVLRRLRDGGAVYREQLVECLGAGACVDGIAGAGTSRSMLETVLRISVAADSPEPVEQFTREIAPLVTCGPQGTTGYATGRPSVLPIFGYWPCLINRGSVQPTFHLLD